MHPNTSEYTRKDRPVTDTNENVLEQAAMEIATLDAEIKELMERRDLLKSHFKDGGTYSPGKYNFGRVTLVVSTNQRISQKKAESIIRRPVLEQISVLKVDSKRARALLTDAELESIMDHYDNKIEVRLND